MVVDKVVQIRQFAIDKELELYRNTDGYTPPIEDVGKFATAIERYILSTEDRSGT